MEQRFLALIRARWVLHFKRYFWKWTRAPGGAVVRGMCFGNRALAFHQQKDLAQQCSASLPPPAAVSPGNIPWQFWGFWCWKHTSHKCIHPTNLTGVIVHFWNFLMSNSSSNEGFMKIFINTYWRRNLYYWVEIYGTIFVHFVHFSSKVPILCPLLLALVKCRPWYWQVVRFFSFMCICSNIKFRIL